jgi:predicted nuclease of predicted toxin-antitoxin system
MIPLKKAISKSLNHVIRSICGRKKTRELFNIVNIVKDVPQIPCIYEVCCKERRCLVTLDLDFSEVTRFPPDKSGGIVVIRIPRNPSLDLLEKLVQQFLRATSQMPLEGELWIVEIGRIRIYQKATD